jgi:hypothetical protein
MELMIRAVVFSGHNIDFTGTKCKRHEFGVRLLRVLCVCMSLSDACGQHAMLLWTLSMSRMQNGCGMDVCVACLIISAKMHQISACAGLSKFAAACRRLFESRESTTRALEWTLQQNTGMLDKQVHQLTCVLKLFESVELIREVCDISSLHLKYAEIFVLFTIFKDQWFRYFIEMYEYLLEKTKHVANDARMNVIMRVCGVENN